MSSPTQAHATPSAEALTSLFQAHCADCEAEAAEVIDLPFSGKTLYRFKVSQADLLPEQASEAALAATTDVNHEIVLDELGQPVKANKLLAEERKARRKAIGHLSLELAEFLESAPLDEAVEVYLWGATQFPEVDRDRMESDEAYEEEYEALFEAEVTWDATGSCGSNPPNDCLTPINDADLDLRLYVNGGWVASSSSYPNNYEFATYTNGTAGTQAVSIRVYRYSYNSTNTFMGIAWDSVGSYFYEDLCETTATNAPFRTYSEQDGSGADFKEQQVDVAALDNTEHVVVWSAQKHHAATNGNETDILVQVLSRDGILKAAEDRDNDGVREVLKPIQVNEHKDENEDWICGGTGDQERMQATHPRVAALTHDSYAVVWQERCDEEDGNRIMLRFFSLFEPDTNPIEITATTSNDNLMITPDVAGFPDPNGDGSGVDDYVWITWIEQGHDSVDGNAYAVSCTRTGCNTPMLLGTALANTEEEAFPSITRYERQPWADGAAIVWIDAQGDVSLRRVLTPSSFIDTAPITLNETGQNRVPAVASFNNGSIVVSWINDTTTRLRYAIHDRWSPGAWQFGPADMCTDNSPPDIYDCDFPINNVSSISHPHPPLDPRLQDLHQRPRATAGVKTLMSHASPGVSKGCPERAPPALRGAPPRRRASGTRCKSLF